MNRIALNACMWGMALMFPMVLCAQEKDSLGQTAPKENTLKVDLQMSPTARYAMAEWLRPKKTRSRNS